MSDLREFEELEKDICAFAKEMHGKEHKVHYEGPFITGNLENPEILFLSINPGGGEEKEVNCGKFKSKELTYLEQLKDPKKNEQDKKLAKSLFKIFDEENREILKNSCETYFQSFFATAKEENLNELLTTFKENKTKHDELCEKALSLALKTKPKMIVIIGVGNFDYFCHNNNLEWNRNNEKLVSKRRYLLSTEYNGIPVYGIIHLSGARPSNAMKDELQRFFAEKISKN